jgi:hypothetical protein
MRRSSSVDSTDESNFPLQRTNTGWTEAEDVINQRDLHGPSVPVGQMVLQRLPEGPQVVRQLLQALGQLWPPTVFELKSVLRPILRKLRRFPQPSRTERDVSGPPAQIVADKHQMLRVFRASC